MADGTSKARPGAASLDDLRGPLTSFLRDVMEAPELEVTGIGRLSGGASRETYAIDFSRGPVARAAMQRVRPGALASTFSMVRESRLLAAAQQCGVPVSDMLAATDDPSIAGAPFLLASWIDGETIARRILRDEPFARARSVLVGDAARALAGIHSIPLAEVEITPAVEPLGSLREMFDHLGEPHPAFELAFRWLEQHRPDRSAASTVVHGDFRLGNLMVDESGLAAVLDWELAHVGDPMEDLGWFCVKAWRFGVEPPVAGLGQYGELFSAYEDASGQTVDPEVVHWWEVYGTLRWGVICILQAQTHLTGASRSVELAAIGRRVCENEHDLLELLP